MKIAPFRIEEFYEQHEFTAELMLSSSDCESITVADLLEFEQGAGEQLAGLHLGYTEVWGAPELRAAAAGLYTEITADDVLVLAAAEEAIFTTMHALLGPGDHAVIETPCYEAALTVARSTGAAVDEWQRHFSDGWAHDMDALERLLRPDTRVVYVNSPHNPTGMLMPRAILERIAGLCDGRGITLICDEVYRGLEHDPQDILPAACDISAGAVSLGSMSKTYGLPGLRLGWLASRDRKALRKIADLKLYTTICSSAPSELLAAIALRHHASLAERNRGIVTRNLELLAAFFERRADRFSWVRPTASPICFPRVADGVDAFGLCERLLADTGVLLLPGTVYDEPAHIRFGYGRANMPEALARLDAWL